MKNRISLASGFVAALLLATIQIPSSAHMPESLSMATGMSKAQITKVGDAINQSFAQAMATAKTTTSDSTLNTSVMLLANGRFKCSAGGYIDTTYTMRSITTKSTGNATITASGRQTFTGWRCITGWTINGNPYISHGLSGSVVAGKKSMRGTMGGGWKATGPNKFKQNCRLSGITQYATTGNSGVTTIRINCVPGGTTNIAERF